MSGGGRAKAQKGAKPRTSKRGGVKKKAAKKQAKAKTPPRPRGIAEEVMAFVEAHPGSPIGVIKDQVAPGWSSLYAALNVLRATGRIKARKKGRIRFIYPADALPEGVTTKDLEMLSSSGGEVARAIAKAGRIDMGDLLDRLEMQPRMIYYQVKRLVDAGLVRRASKTRYVGLRSTPRLQRAFDELERGF